MRETETNLLVAAVYAAVVYYRGRGQVLRRDMIETVSQEVSQPGNNNQCKGCGKKIQDRYLLQALGRLGILLYINRNNCRDRYF